MQSVAQFPKVFQLENVPVAFKIFPYYCHVRKETSLGYGKCRSLYVWYKPKYREQDVEWKSKLHISLKEIIIVHVVFIILPFILRVMITADHVQLTQKTSLHQKGCTVFFLGLGLEFSSQGRNWKTWHAKCSFKIRLIVWLVCALMGKPWKTSRASHVLDTDEHTHTHTNRVFEMNIFMLFQTDDFLNWNTKEKFCSMSWLLFSTQLEWIELPASWKWSCLPAIFQVFIHETDRFGSQV